MRTVGYEQLPIGTWLVVGYLSSAICTFFEGMPDYDFKILQPNEFECLSRDLIQARDGVFIESQSASPRFRSEK